MGASPQALYPPFSVGLGPGGGLQAAGSGCEPAVSEVHLRRLDRPDMMHRRAVALISINATPDEVRPRAVGQPRALCARKPSSVPRSHVYVIWELLSKRDKALDHHKP